MTSYLSVAEFRARSGANVSGSDDALQACLDSATEQIDGYCARTFGQVTEPRYFSPRGACRSIKCGDVVSISEIAFDTTLDRTWPTIADAAWYELAPANPRGGRPYDRVEWINNALGAWGYFPMGTRSVRITGVWGWPNVPAPIVEVCYLIANRLHSLWTAPFGKTGAGDMGAGINMTNALTPAIEAMLAPYRDMVT